MLLYEASLPGLRSNICQGRKLCSQAPTKLLSGIDFCLPCFFFLFFFRFMAKDTDLAMNAMQQTNLTVSYILYACTYGYAVVIDNV